jgi:probable F420-dependent oxidoreductase
MVALMHVSTTTPTEDLTAVRNLFPELESVGYDRAFSFEAKHNPFIPLAVAGARTPMTLANAAWDLQTLTGGRMTLGLGSQVKPHIEQRYSMPWSAPVERMREMVLATRAIFDAWQNGTDLNFEGRFYTHTRMIPAFDPGPNEFGPPPIFTAGVGPRMTALAGEVADGFLVHPVNSRKSLQELTLPSISEGAARVGRDPAEVEVVCVTIVVTGENEETFERSREAVRGQLAFYGSTPAYRPVFDLHGYGDLHPELRNLARQGRWDEMATLIDDDLIETIAVVGEPAEVARGVRARLDGISRHVSLVNNRAPDPGHFAGIVGRLKEPDPS